MGNEKAPGIFLEYSLTFFQVPSRYRINCGTPVAFPHLHPLYLPHFPSTSLVMSSITLRRCTVDRKTGKTMYDRVVEEGQALGDTNLGAHEIDVTFRRAKPTSRGNIYYDKLDGTPFVASFIAEIGSEAQGTWMAAYPKKSPPLYQLASTPYARVTSY